MVNNVHFSRKMLADLSDPTWPLRTPADTMARHEKFRLKHYEKTALIAKGRVGKVWRCAWDAHVARLPGHPAEVAMKKV